MKHEDAKKYEFLVVNCDKREFDFMNCLKNHPWAKSLHYQISDEKIAHLETGANADVIPKLSIYHQQRGNIAACWEKPVVVDCKKDILGITEGTPEECQKVYNMITEKITTGVENRRVEE